MSNERREAAEARARHVNGDCDCDFPNECLFEAGYKAALSEQPQGDEREAFVRVLDRWSGRTLGRADIPGVADSLAAALATPSDPPDPVMAATLHWCSECEGISSEKAWDAAWWEERSRRMGDRERIVEMEWSTESTSTYGLDDRMVCPRCKYVHADDDCSAVEEVSGFATAFKADPENEIESAPSNPGEPTGRRFKAATPDELDFASEKDRALARVRQAQGGER